MKGEPLSYYITISPDGTVRLSKSWNWCNIPMASMEEAEREMEKDADGQAFTVTRKRIKF